MIPLDLSLGVAVAIITAMIAAVATTQLISNRLDQMTPRFA